MRDSFCIGSDTRSLFFSSIPVDDFGSTPDGRDGHAGSYDRVERAIGDQWPEGSKKKLKEQEIIQRILKDYDWRVRPLGNNDSWPGKKSFARRRIILMTFLKCQIPAVPLWLL